MTEKMNKLDGAEVGLDLKTIQALQRRHLNLERELAPVEEKVNRVNLLANSVKVSYPNEKGTCAAFKQLSTRSTSTRGFVLCFRKRHSKTKGSSSVVAKRQEQSVRPSIAFRERRRATDFHEQFEKPIELAIVGKRISEYRRLGARRRNSRKFTQKPSSNINC